MSEPERQGRRGGIGPLGWVLIVIAVIFLFGWLISLVLGFAGLVVTAVFKAIGVVIGAIGAAFGIVFGLLGGFFALLASFGVVVLLLLPGIIVGILIARAMSRRKGK